MPSTRTKLAPKKIRQQFIAKITAMLLDLGAEPRDYEFALQTKAGLLRIFPTENITEGLGTVFTRFEDPKRPGNWSGAIRIPANGTSTFRWLVYRIGPE